MSAAMSCSGRHAEIDEHRKEEQPSVGPEVDATAWDQETYKDIIVGRRRCSTGIRLYSI